MSNVTAHKIYLCRETVQLLSDRNLVTLMWVLGHSDIEDNEIADSLGKAGAQEPIIGPEPCLKVPQSYFKGQIGQWKRSAFIKH